MYCFLQYIDVPKNVPEVNDSVLSIQSVSTLQSASSNMVGTKKFMFNPNCPVQIILDYVCSEIGIDKNSDYDFCNLETGEMLGIKLLKPWSYPTNILKPKLTYVIVFYEEDEFGHYSKLEPLINRQSKQYSETMLRIKRNISTTVRRMSSSGTRKTGGKRASSKGSTTDSFGSHKQTRTKSIGSTRSKKSLDSKK